VRRVIVYLLKTDWNALVKLTATVVRWILLLLLLSGTSAPAATTIQDGPWAGHLFAQHALGAWQGTGTVYGNEVSLTRTWSLELANQFLLADMSVEMSNGFAFRAMAYWRIVESGSYEITWLDEGGETETFRASGTDSSTEIVIYQMEPASDDAPAGWRKVVHKITGADSYQELMYYESEGAWTGMADFRFTREKE
jgi:hypothetical protein